MPRIIETIYGYKPDLTLLKALTPKTGERQGVSVKPSLSGGQSSDLVSLIVTLNEAVEQKNVIVTFTPVLGGEVDVVTISSPVNSPKALEDVFAAIMFLRDRMS